MIRLSFAIGIAVLPLKALALSCIAPTVERSYAQFASADETYLIVHGRVTFDAKLLPKALTANSKPPELTLVPAQLVGKSLTKDGFNLPFEQSITLNVTCLGPWCGSIKDGEDLLAFVQKSDAGYALAVTPCGGSAFGSPKAAQIKKVVTCFRDGTCSID